ncbi:MAG: hypothetical protein AAB443_01910 [Patescibacteria group bacterium]
MILGILLGLVVFLVTAQYYRENNQDKSFLGYKLVPSDHSGSRRHYRVLGKGSHRVKILGFKLERVHWMVFPFSISLVAFVIGVSLYFLATHTGQLGPNSPAWVIQRLITKTLNALAIVFMTSLIRLGYWLSQFILG